MDNNNSSNLKTFFIKLISISLAIIIIANVLFNLIVSDKIKHLDSFFGLEYLAPFFHSQRETLFDYISTDALVVFDEEDDVFFEING